jgi:hypothetical protein
VIEIGFIPEFGAHLLKLVESATDEDDMRA